MNWSRSISPMTDLCATDRSLWVAACTSGIKEKEIRESFDFADRIQSITRHRHVLEIGCGHGLVGHILAAKGFARSVHQIDIRETRAHQVLPGHAGGVGNVFYSNIDASQGVINELTGLEFSAVIGVHLCGSLTDVAIELATTRNANVAVVPCCENKVKDKDSRKYLQIYGTLGLEVHRVQRLMGAGYEVSVRTLKRAITPANRIIIGKAPNGGKDDGKRNN